MQNSITKLKAILDSSGTVNVRFAKGPKGTIKAEINFIVKEDNKDVNLPPVVIQGTYDEMDFGFFDLLGKSADKITGSYVDTDEFDKVVTKKTKGTTMKGAEEKTLLDTPVKTVEPETLPKEDITNDDLGSPLISKSEPKKEEAVGKEPIVQPKFDEDDDF